ncbi:RNA polymerase sigma-70 factor, ECF subfamily [Paenimyroides aquimaris]|uniref:RNA polymerase sigma-70 factor, ECF subfamily n=1 Tax=Paenimyroides marinum TaxID=1159016 RepID=A0A1H6LM10_9FLAO|nr:sigma-70 family RNA polymerase sigma factor [Paenimyroides aquimaris]SEH86449.1 RNA polymerase sigma-70 factor, ECF subfamily [Paenimyroides aquimaris]
MMSISIENYQRMLFPYAYNVLGTVEDAEDVIQDVVIQFSKVSSGIVNNPKNYLIKSVINQAIQLKQKQNKTVPADVWLPEPVITDEDLQHQEIFNFSLLARMEQLNPKERAVFILKEGFGHSHEEIGEILSLTTENSRKILSRAKERLKSIGSINKLHFRPVVSDIVKKLINAIRDGDTDNVKTLLAEDIQFYADGGTKVKVVAKECIGADQVNKLLMYVHQTYNSALEIKLTMINHQPAVLFIQGGVIESCQIFEIYQNKIIRIDAVVDPEKLKTLI